MYDILIPILIDIIIIITISSMYILIKNWCQHCVWFVCVCGVCVCGVCVCVWCVVCVCVCVCVCVSVIFRLTIFCIKSSYIL